MSTSLVYRRIFLSGPGGDAPAPDGWTSPWLPQVKALAVGPGDDVWIAGRFFSPLHLGTTELTSAGYGDLFVARLDREGNPRWARRLGGPQDESCGGMALDTEGNAIVVQEQPLQLVKLDANGDLLWQRPVMSPSGEGPLTGGIWGAGADGAGGILLVATNFVDGSHIVTRVDANGHALWTVSSLHAGEPYPAGMVVDRAGSTIIGAGRSVSGTLRLGKVSAWGAVQIDRRFRGYGEGGNFDGVGVDPQGNILLSGSGGTVLAGTTPPEHRHDAWIAKLDPGGLKTWQLWGIAGRMAADRKGNVLYATLHKDFSSVGKLDPEGHWLWKYSPRIDGDGEVAAVTADSTGRVIYAGTFQGHVDFGDGPAESGERAALFVAALAP